MVVSEIKDRLSPNIAPPITAAIESAKDISVCSLIPTPIGARATIVPIDVPIDKEIKQAITNIPTIRRFCGTTDNARFTVESTAPIPFAVAEKAPANKKITTISITLPFPAPRQKMSTLFVKDSFGFIAKATAAEIAIATITGNA